MTEKLEWLRYGALGFAGLALTTTAGLIQRAGILAR